MIYTKHLQIYHTSSTKLKLAGASTHSTTVSDQILITILVLTIIPRNSSGLLFPLSPDITRARLSPRATNRRSARNGPIGKIIEALPPLLVLPLNIKIKYKRRGEGGWLKVIENRGNVYMNIEQKLQIIIESMIQKTGHTKIVFTKPGCLQECTALHQKQEHIKLIQVVISHNTENCTTKQT